MSRILAFPGEQPTSTTNSFATIQTDAGTSPVASSSNDTLTLTSSDGSLLITGNAGTDTVDFSVVGSGSGAPANALYLTLATNATLTQERVFTPGTSLSATDGGAGGNYSLDTIQDIRTSASPTFTGLTLSGLGLGVVHSSAGGVFSSSLIVNADVSASAAIAYSKLNLTGSIVNADVNAAAAIAYSKLNLTGSIVNADINASAAIAYSKLNLTGSIVNADIAAAAAIAITKIANGTANQLIKANAGATANEFATLSGGTGLSVTFGVGTIALANTGVTSLVATTNQTTVSGATGAVTIGTVQDIGTGSSPTFTGLTLSGLGLGIVHSSSGGVLSSSLIVNADVSASAAIAFSKLATLTSANILVGSVGNVATAVAVTGDISLTNAGVTAYAGTVPINKGGTNITTFSSGDILYSSAANVLSKRAIGSTGDILTVAGGIPTWAAPAAAAIAIGTTVTSGTTGSILFVGSGPVLAQDNAALFYTVADDSVQLSNTAAGSINSHTISGASIKHRLTVASEKTGTDIEDLAIWNWSSTAAQGSRLALIRSKGTQGTPAVVASGDELCMISAQGFDGTDYEIGGLIQGFVDGTPGSNDMPFRWTISCSPDGSATPLEMLTVSGGTLNRLQIFAGQPSFTVTENILNYIPIFTANPSANATHSFINYSSTITATPGAAAFLNINVIGANPSVTFTGGLGYIYNCISHTGTFTNNANPLFANTFNLFYAAPTLKSATAGVSPMATTGMFISNFTTRAENVNVNSASAIFGRGFAHSATYSTNGASSVMTITDDSALVHTGTYSSTVLGGVLTISLRRLAAWKNLTSTATGTVVITANVGLDIEDQSLTAGNLTVTRNSGIRSALVANAANFLIDDTGGAQVSLAGKVTKYNNIATVSNGIPSELATIDLTAQAVAIGDTALYTPTATGLFRISIYLQVTRAASTSSVLGGTTGVVIKYNDGDGNVAQANTAALATTAGAIAITAAGNTTATNLEGTMVIYARTGVGITYSVGYTSVGVQTMQYSVRLKVEAL